MKENILIRLIMSLSETKLFLLKLVKGNEK